MKKRILSFFIIILFISQNIYSQSGWVQLTSPTTKFIYSVFFVNDYIGFIGCDSGTIYKTTNGGLNWSYMNILSVNPVSSIYFANDLTGFAGCPHEYNQGKLVKTTNGGINWNALNIQSNDVDIRDIYFVNSNVGFIAAFYNLYKTTNSGNNWDTTGYLGYYNYTTLIYSVHFLDVNTGFVGGNSQFPHAFYNGIIWKSTNGGQNWTIVNITSGTEILDFSFCNSYTGFAVGSYHIVKTTNRGENWMSMNLNIYLGSIFAISPDTIFTCGSWGLYNSINGGQNWSQIPIPNESYGQVFFADHNTGYIVGSNYMDYGAIYKTTDGGTTNIEIFPDEFPKTYKLYPNYPNPFNPSTKIKFEIPKSSFTKLIIYDILGREVAILVNEQLKPGTYEYEWDGSNFASGIYFYKLEAGDISQTKRMVLLK